MGHLIRSVDCDVTGSLWCHQKAVLCLDWDKSIGACLLHPYVHMIENCLIFQIWLFSFTDELS